MTLRSLTVRPAQSITEFAIVGLRARGLGDFSPFEAQKGILVLSQKCHPMLGLEALDHGPNDLDFLKGDLLYVMVEMAEGWNDYELGLAEACARKARAIYEGLILCGLRLDGPARMVTGFRGASGGEAEKVLALRPITRTSPAAGVIGAEGLLRMACLMVDNQLMRMQVTPGQDPPEAAIRRLIHGLQLSDVLARLHQLVHSLAAVAGVGDEAARRCRLFAGDDPWVLRCIGAAQALMDDAAALKAIPDRAIRASATKAVLAWAEAYMPLLEELAAEVCRRMAMRPGLWRAMCAPDFWAGLEVRRELLWGEPIPLKHLAPEQAQVDAISEAYHRETERGTRFRRLQAPGSSSISRAA